MALMEGVWPNGLHSALRIRRVRLERSQGVIVLCSGVGLSPCRIRTQHSQVKLDSRSASRHPVILIVRGTA